MAQKLIDKLQTPKAIKWFWILLASPVALILLLLLLIGIGVFGKLPTFEELENPKSNLATEIYSEDGKMIGSFFVQNRSYCDYDELSPSLVAGIGLNRRHAFLFPFGYRFHLPGACGRTYDRTGPVRTGRRQYDLAAAGQEPLPARYRGIQQSDLERIEVGRFRSSRSGLQPSCSSGTIPKEEIIAMYLNTVEYGSNAYGIKSAAQHFLQQAALGAERSRRRRCWSES